VQSRSNFLKKDKVKMRMTKKTGIAIGVLAALAYGRSALAYDETSAVNLGLTAILDGVPPAGPGWYYQNYLQFYSSSSLNGGNGQRLPLPKTDLQLTADVSQIIYLSPHKTGPGAFGFDALLPAFVTSHVSDGLDNAVLSTRNGFGDIIFGPFYQFDPVLVGGKPFLSQRVELDVSAPTGGYDPARSINPGANAWLLEPYYSATMWFSEKLSVSMRATYYYNFKNSSPNQSLGPDANTSRAGQAISINFSAEYQVARPFYLGVAGYYFKQVTDLQVNGESVEGQKERVFGIGPVASYAVNKDTFLIVNAFKETSAANRPRGTRIIARFMVHF
jgi:hypothetical protein